MRLSFTSFPENKWAMFFEKIRSSHPRCSVRVKGVLRNFAKFKGTLLKKRLWHRCFPVKFAKFLRTPFYRAPMLAGSKKLIIFAKYRKDWHCFWFLTSKQRKSSHLIQIFFLFWSNHWRCSIKEAVLKYFANFTGKNLCRSLFLIKPFINRVFVKKRPQRRCFLVKSAKFLRTPFL